MEVTQSPRVSDRSLIERCRTGDQTAWEELVEKYQRLVMSVPLSFHFGHEEAEDIAQIVFTILMQCLDSLRHLDNISSWLYTVAQRHTWRALKRSQRNAAEPLNDNTAESRAFLSSQGLPESERMELAEWLNQGLLQLNPRCQKLLVALYLDPEEPLYSEIVERLNIPLGSIGPTRARCLEQLRRLLGDGNGGGDDQ